MKFGRSISPRSARLGAHPWRRSLWAVPALAIAVAASVPAAASAAPVATRHAAAHHDAPAVATHPVTHPDRLAAGGRLASGAWLSSPNGEYQYAMQLDGNLVLYWNGHPLWATNTAGHAGAFATMQGDGNFVVYQGKRALWASNSGRSGNRAYYLLLQNDGNAVVYSPTNWPMWASYTALGPTLSFGNGGSPVRVLQVRLEALGYWLGTPDSNFGDSTQQAVWAIQKAAGLNRDGVVGPSTVAAIEKGVVPTPRSAPGYLIEVNLEQDLLMVVNNGKLLHVLNTSTGGGYTYVSQGVTSVAITPTGIFHLYSEINGTDVAPLGVLWRPKFFTGGFAIHGDSYVPPVPVSHGCVRVSNEAIDWIWAANIAPLGTEVWVF
jgi:peptidoglycan hydrolase-like protein with peptidoglycan-binding domain